MTVNYPNLPDDYCIDCGKQIPAGESCGCYAGNVFTKLFTKLFNVAN